MKKMYLCTKCLRSTRVKPAPAGKTEPAKPEKTSKVEKEKTQTTEKTPKVKKSTIVAPVS